MDGRSRIHVGAFAKPVLTLPLKQHLYYHVNSGDSSIQTSLEDSNTVRKVEGSIPWPFRGRFTMWFQSHSPYYITPPWLSTTCRLKKSNARILSPQHRGSLTWNIHRRFALCVPSSCHSSKYRRIYESNMPFGSRLTMCECRRAQQRSMFDCLCSRLTVRYSDCHCSRLTIWRLIIDMLSEEIDLWLPL